MGDSTKMRAALTLLLFGFCWSSSSRAEEPDPNLIREVSAVRAELARNKAAFGQYTWTALIEVSVKGDLKSSEAYKCRYDRNGQVLRTLAKTDKEMDTASGVSKRRRVRSKSEMQDYIERAITRIYQYVPPNPEQIDVLLKSGHATMGPSSGGTSEVRFTNYFEKGDTLAFTYDSASKVLLRVRVASTLGSPKDPVTLEAAFETLPEGVNHMSSAILNATAKKVEVKIKNATYEKVTN
jgi:hypothetical protein